MPEESGLSYTTLSPNFFMMSWIGLMIGSPLHAHQLVTLVGESRRYHSLVSIADVAAFTIATVSHPAAINTRLVFGEPEPLSWRGIVAVFGKVISSKTVLAMVRLTVPVFSPRPIMML